MIFNRSLRRPLRFSLIFCLIAATGLISSLPRTLFARSFVTPAIGQQEISDGVVELLAAGDLNGAIIAMREEPSSPKLLYLLRELSRIHEAHSGRKPEKSQLHSYDQNLAISNHNVFLFLQSRGADGKKFMKEAHRFYRKARSEGTPLHRAECNLLRAALTASSGDIKKAEKLFSKIDQGALRSDYASMEYLAAYYAAVGAADHAVEALEKAHEINPDGALTWLAVGDDFHGIEKSEPFRKKLVEWRAAEAARKLALTAKKSGTKPKHELSDEASSFRPQKAMPHYDLKKKKKVKGKKKNLTRHHRR